jgi:hypothetical protein
LCPVRLSAGNSPHRKNPAEPVKREAEEGWGKARGEKSRRRQAGHSLASVEGAMPKSKD